MTSLRITSSRSPVWPVVLYIVGSLIVLASTLMASGSSRPLILLLHLGAFVAVTALGWQLLPGPKAAAGKALLHPFLLCLSAVTAAFILAYPWLNGAPPLIVALSTNDFDIIAGVRSRAISSDIAGFVLRMVVHGAAPVLILYLFLTTPRRFALGLVAAMVGGASLLLFKSMPLIMLTPLGFFAALERRWRLLAAVVATVAGILVCQVIATNPHLRGYAKLAVAHLIVTPAMADDARPSVGTVQAFRVSVAGLLDRAFKRPGEGVATWLALVPDKVPFSKGCSVRVIALWSGCEYRDLPREIYAIAYPDYAARGLRGSLDVPHYVQDYAMFGPLGLLFSGVAAAAGLLTLRLAAGEPHPAYFMAIVMTAFVTGTPQLLLSEGGLLAALLIILIGHASANAPSDGSLAGISGQRTTVRR